MKESHYYSSDKSRVLELSCGRRGECYILSVLIIWGIEDRQKPLDYFRPFLSLKPWANKSLVSTVFMSPFWLRRSVLSVRFFLCVCVLQVRVTLFVWWSWVTIGCRRTRSTKTSTQSGTRSSLCEWLLKYNDNNMSQTVCIHCGNENKNWFLFFKYRSTGKVRATITIT